MAVLEGGARQLPKRACCAVAPQAGLTAFPGSLTGDIWLGRDRDTDPGARIKPWPGI